MKGKGAVDSGTASKIRSKRKVSWEELGKKRQIKRVKEQKISNRALANSS